MKQSKIGREYIISELIEKGCNTISENSGLYWVIVPEHFDYALKMEVNYPKFFPKYKNKTIALETLESRLTKYKSGETDILYIGQAQNLKSRIEQLVYFEYQNYSNKKTLPHYGGRAIWQLINNRDLIIRCSTYDGDLDEMETVLIDQFILDHDPACKKLLPYANEKRGRKKYRLFDE